MGIIGNFSERELFTHISVRNQCVGQEHNHSFVKEIRDRSIAEAVFQKRNIQTNRQTDSRNKPGSGLASLGFIN